MPTPWLLWSDSAHDPAWNMAADDVLLSMVALLEAPILRTYAWDRPAVTLGYFQPARLGEELGVAWVRRPTGGGVVDHRHDVTFTVVLPPDHELARVDRFACYHRLNAAVQRALAAAGQAELWLSPDDIPKSVNREELVCFATPAKHDVVGPRGKLAGGAQRRTAVGLLHQGSIDLSQYPALGPAAVLAALPGGFAAEFGVGYEKLLLPCEFAAAVANIVATKYGTPAWNAKR